FRDLDLLVGPDVRNAVASNHDDALVHEPAGVAVKDAAGANHDRARRCGALGREVVDAETWLRSRAAPRRAGTARLRMRDCGDDHAQRAQCERSDHRAHANLPVGFRDATPFATHDATEGRPGPAMIRDRDGRAAETRTTRARRTGPRTRNR